MSALSLSLTTMVAAFLGSAPSEFHRSDAAPMGEPVDCQVGPWSAWSECSASCGTGTQTRTREIVVAAEHGGAACPSTLEEQRQCNTHPCPVDCQVGAWSAWSECSASCGTGTQTRTREIVVAAEHGGAACPSTLEEQRQCNTHPCPVDCQVSAWSAWSECSASCGGGVRTRTRDIIQPAENGGMQCPDLEQSEACNVQACPECTVDADCDDSDPCTAETCSVDTCVYEDAQGSCDDGDECTVDDTCVAGVCQGHIPDADGDGVGAASCGGSDCNDSAPNVHPDAKDICEDGIDQDCNGEDLACPCPDADGDGAFAADCGGQDCDDKDPTISPDVPEDCQDGVDNNCNGNADADDPSCKADAALGDPTSTPEGGCQQMGAPMGGVLAALLPALLERRRRQRRAVL